jgi:hypothetical protein
MTVHFKAPRQGTQAVGLFCSRRPNDSPAPRPQLPHDRHFRHGLKLGIDGNLAKLLKLGNSPRRRHQAT